MPTPPRRRRSASSGQAPLKVVPPPAPRPVGRAWINGREVAGPHERIAHLARGYD